MCGCEVMRCYELRAIQGLVKDTRVTRHCVVESSRCVLGEGVGLAGRPQLSICSIVSVVDRGREKTCVRSLEVSRLFRRVVEI